MTIIIIIIIAVIIFALLGGFGSVVLTEDMSNLRQLSSQQWECREIVWTKTPKIVDGVFEGEMNLSCDFEALHGGGIIELRKYLADRIPTVAETVHGEQVKTVQGLPAVVYDVTMKLEDNRKREIGKVRGKTYLATDGFTALRNVFITEQVLSGAAAPYLKAMRSELLITPYSDTNESNWFTLQFTNSSRIVKPALIPVKTFKKEVVERMEKDMREKSQSVLTSLANHL